MTNKASVSLFTSGGKCDHRFVADGASIRGVCRHQFRRDAERRHSLGSKRPELPPWHKKKEGNRPAFTWKVTYCKHAGVAGYVPVDDKEIMSRKDKTLTIIDPKLGLIQVERTT